MKIRLPKKVQSENTLAVGPIASMRQLGDRFSHRVILPPFCLQPVGERARCRVAYLLLQLRPHILLPGLYSPPHQRFILPQWTQGLHWGKYECVLKSFSHAWLFMSPWFVACQTPLSMGFSRQKYWSGLPCLPPGDFPDSEIEPPSPGSPADSLPTELSGKPEGSICVL